MNTFQIRNKTWKGPESFDELTPKQLAFFALLTLKRKSRNEIFRTVGYRFSSIPFWYYFKLNRIQQSFIEDKYEFLMEEFTMKSWKFPKVKSRFNVYYGPEGPLKNTSGAEFAYADKYFSAYAKSKDIKDLNRFIACLYRDATTGGNWLIDMREPFEFRKIESNAKKIRKVPMEIKYAIYLNYIGVRADMVKSFPNVFNNKNQSKAKSFGWPGIFYELSGDKLGKEEEVQNKFIWNLLAIMEMNEIRRMEREAEMESRKTTS